MTVSKSLVTGADGFVGEHLLKHLLERGNRVAATALTLPPTRSTLSSEQMTAVEWKQADVQDQDALFRVLAAVQPERVYHLAGFASGALARQQAETAMALNAGGTVNLCEAVLSVRDEFPEFDPRVLVLGSGDAYGDAAADGDPLTEEMQLRPVGVFGLSKACQELAAHTYRRAHGVRTVVARGFNLVGQGQQPDFVVPDFCVQVAAVAREERPPRIQVGNLDVERDFTDVRDGVRAFTAIMDLEDPDAAYNVCSGRATAVRAVLDWILDEAGIEVEVEVAPERVRRGEPTRMVGDPSLLHDETGWEPRHEFEETVRAVYRSIAG